MISRRFRFHGHGSLSYLFRKGHTARGPRMIVRSIRNERRRYSRVAIIVSKKVAKRAHDRNRIRRRLYELMRGHLEYIPLAYDVAIIVTDRETATIPAPALAHELDHLLGSSRLLSPAGKTAS